MSPWRAELCPSHHSGQLLLRSPRPANAVSETAEHSPAQGAVWPMARGPSLRRDGAEDSPGTQAGASSTPKYRCPRRSHIRAGERGSGGHGPSRPSPSAAPCPSSPGLPTALPLSPTAQARTLGSGELGSPVWLLPGCAPQQFRPAASMAHRPQATQGHDDNTDVASQLCRHLSHLRRRAPGSPRLLGRGPVGSGARGVGAGESTRKPVGNACAHRACRR